MKLALYNRIQDLCNYAESGVTRVGTGIAPIDELIRGVAPGEVCYLVGRSYAGKSLLGQNIIWNNRHLPSIFFSMEMPYQQAIARLHSITFDVNAVSFMDTIEAGNVPDNIWDLVNEYPRHAIVDDTNIGFEDMSRYVSEFQYGYGERPAFVVVDYLELLGGAKRSGEGFVAVDKVATMLKDWAKGEEMRVFVLHQANRQEPKWKPITEDSPRFGGFTEADQLIGLWKPSFNPDKDYYERLAMRDDVHFNVIKNRPYGQETELIKARLTPSLRIVADTI